MKNSVLKVLGILVGAGICAQSQAALISVSGPTSTLGGYASIISAPADVRDDAAFNTAQQGFDENQGVTLSRNIQVDSGWISMGTVVDSHMIFLNTGPGNATTYNAHNDVTWVFDGDIIGVMSDFSGAYETASTDLLGLATSTYPLTPFSARGMEGADSYTIAGNMLTVSMAVTEPGDWIRVVTRATAVPEPSVMALMGIGLVGMGFAQKRRNRKG
ncbi:MAG TPA: PEP-CTERM sorting domain-containing protein [Gammaproteobacteria bacterium]|nr:PEP-CTERM sorting domain-containing protein [Gammaproteobacteria bacterium]